MLLMKKHTLWLMKDIKTNYKGCFAKQLKDNIIKHFPFYIALFVIEITPKLEMAKFDYITKIKEKYELSKINEVLADLSEYRLRDFILKLKQLNHQIIILKKTKVR